MQLIDIYRKEILAKHYQADDLQEEAILALQKISDAFVKSPKQKAKWYSALRRHKVEAVKGLYLWGSVGRGKTFIMDMFFEYAKTPYKRRVHFNHFMKYVHQNLVKHKGKRNPLGLVADQIADEVRLLCFDEFFVEDIADAMILGDLFKHLFEDGVTLVATSNVKPELLYAGGLQRNSFLPAIAALVEHTEEFNLDSGIDYRWRTMKQQNRYHTPLKGEKKFMADYFDKIAVTEFLENSTFILQGRSIETLRQSDHVLWVEFSVLCGYGRSVADYIDIAGHFDSVLISNIPILDENLEDEARRFIALVDEFYDRKVALIISASVPMQELYQGDRLTFEFQRTLSRLNEMQSDEFIDEVRLRE
jgi:cell division protein ZapE